jgi:hypothetical protein
MSSYRQLLYHIVFRTKDSKATLRQENFRDLKGGAKGMVHLHVHIWILVISKLHQQKGEVKFICSEESDRASAKGFKM